MPIEPRYDGVADWYDDYIQSSPHTADALESLADLLGPGSGTCLDVGCGTGIAFRDLAALGWTVVGVDVSADQLRIARGRAEAVGGRVEPGDAAHLRFATGSFDAVVSLLTHTDFDDAATVFREAARVVRPGGRLAYVGVHPCFVGPMVERRPQDVPRFSPGYQRSGWWAEASGVVRSRVGVNHIPLASLMNAVIDAGWAIDRVREFGGDDYPMLLGLRATRLATPYGDSN